MDATGVTGKVVAWGFIFDNYVLTLHKHVCSTANSFFKYALDDFNRGVVMMGGVGVERAYLSPRCTYMAC